MCKILEGVFFSQPSSPAAVASLSFVVVVVAVLVFAIFLFLFLLNSKSSKTENIYVACLWISLSVYLCVRCHAFLKDLCCATHTHTRIHTQSPCLRIWRQKQSTQTQTNLFESIICSYMKQTLLLYVYVCASVSSVLSCLSLVIHFCDAKQFILKDCRSLDVPKEEV